MINLGVALWMAVISGACFAVGAIVTAEQWRKTGYVFFALAVAHALPTLVYVWTNLYTPVERLVE
jgi:hypothetical protein